MTGPPGLESGVSGSEGWLLKGFVPRTDDILGQIGIDFVLVF